MPRGQDHPGHMVIASPAAVTWSPTHTESSPRSVVYPVALHHSRQPKQHARLLPSNRQGPGSALTGATIPTVELSRPDAWTLAMTSTDGEVIAPLPTSMALIARAGLGACRAEP
jgi:hypothetical protein